MRAFSVLNTRIGRRYLVLFLLISLLPLTLMGWFATRSSESALREQTLAVLRTAVDGAEAQLRDFVMQLKLQVLALAEKDEIRIGLESPTPATAGPLQDFSRLLVKQHEFVPDAQELFIVGPNGRVVASSTPEAVGRDVSSRPA